jgi:hypothetical protein
VMSIATLVIFYLLLRQLVRAPAALFGFALFAAAWWPSLRARQPSEGTIYAVLFALAFIVALKTKRPIWALAAGILAGLLSYEYEPFKAVPIIVALFLAAAAAREALLRAPGSPGAALERGRAVARDAWRPLLIALMAAGIVLVPMIVGTHKGYDLYLTSVHRQEGGRQGNRLADNWRTQLKWAAEIFVPIGPNDYVASPPRDVAGTDLIDPVAAWLAMAGLVASALLAFRGVRALFVMWLVITLGAAAVLLHDFGPWKFVVLVPVVITLAALFVEDLHRLVSRAWGENGARVLIGALALAAAFSMWWNADTLFNSVGPSQGFQASFGGDSAQIYSLCHDLKQGDDSYAFAAGGTPGLTNAFASRRDSPEAELRAWGDLIWACHGLQGVALPAPEELWPLRKVPAGPVALVVADPLSPPSKLIDLLSRVYPGLGQPKTKVGPGGSYTTVMYRLTNSAALSQHGLWGDYTASSAISPPALAPTPVPLGRVDDLSNLSWDASPSPVGETFRVHWQGLMYVGEQTTASVKALTDATSYNVRIDGQLVSVGTSASSVPDNPIPLVPGWHPIEIALTKQGAGGTVQLVWATTDGREQPVEGQDLFPLKDLSGWVQTRTIGLPGGLDEQTTQRLDFAPHYVSAATIGLLAQHDGFEPLLTEERWHGVWQVDAAGDYTLHVDFRSGQVTLLVDGQQVAQSQEFNPNERTLDAALTLSPGAHSVEIVQTLDNEATWAGATVLASRTNAAGAQEAVEMLVTPY